MKWHNLDPAEYSPKVFGLEVIRAIKAAKWHGEYDVRAFRLRGWELMADYTEYNPVSGKKLKQSEWWVWAAK
jgi:hypothetical protein